MSYIQLVRYNRRRPKTEGPNFCHYIDSDNKEGKVIPLQAYGAQRALGRLRLPDSVTSALEGGRLSAVFTPRSILLLILRGRVDPGYMELSDATKKIPSDTTRDRCRDLPTSSAVP
jgi:hypothetical protein